jgi:hypothetical protein
VVARKLNFTEFAEFLLARLYEYDQEEPGGQFNAREIAAELQEPVPEMWPSDAVKALDDRGLIHGIRAMGGEAWALMTGDGRMFVEEQAKERDTVVHEYRERPSNLVFVTGTGHQVAVGTEGSVVQTLLSPETREEIVGLLDAVAETIRDDPSFSDEDRPELLADVEVVRGQLEKREPNRKAIVALLDPLSKMAAISGPVIKIIELLG